MRALSAQRARRVAPEPEYKNVGAWVVRPFRHIVVGALIALTTIAAPSMAAQASTRSSSPKHPTSGTSQLGLTSETLQTNPKVSASCLTEDDYDQRVFSGTLNGSYSTSYQLCDLNTDGYTAGGIGLQSSIAVVGQLSDLTITAPDGTAHHAVLVGQSTSKGSTTYDYAVCYVPIYYTSTDTSSNPLPGGAWQITLSGQITNAQWVTNALMTDVNFQKNYCPSSEQNLAP